jgi:hypothetical protein
MKDMLAERVRRLEAQVVLPMAGKHLAFQVAAPSKTPVGDIVTFLRERGHAIRDGDDVFVMNVGAHGMAEGQAPRDLSTSLLTEELRAAAPISGTWPKGPGWFTFKLDSPGQHEQSSEARFVL